MLNVILRNVVTKDFIRETKMAKKPELLIPAGGPDTLRTAIRYGADAVYMGGEAFGLRAKADNFTFEQMAESIRYAHDHGVKVHVTANILAHDSDLLDAEDYFRSMKEVGPDAFIVADPGMFSLARKICPEIEVHISTQANNTNAGTFNFWYSLGAKRVVAARELSLAEIKAIRAQIPADREIECFIHGAMCISYSGRCLLSNYFTGRDANHGECTHPCRWKYAVMEEQRPGQYLPVYENERGTFIFNSKDLCMIEHIPELVDAGIDSFKIEGRMKTALYVATVARTYRRAIDDFFESKEKYEANLPWYREEIAKCTYRQFSTGFYYGKPDENSQVYDSNTYVSEYIYLGTVADVQGNTAVFEQKNRFFTGETLEIMKPDGTNLSSKVLEIRDEEGKEMESAPHPKQKLFVKLSEMPETGDILRIKER